MKVLHFFKTYWPDTFGGVERTIHAIAKGAQRSGIESEVLSLSRAPEANSVLFDGHMAYKAKLDFDFASTGFSRDVFSRFRALRKSADLVHFHFPWPLMDVVHLTAPDRTPTIVTYHSDIVKQKTLLHLYKPVMRQFLKRVDRIVATSPSYTASSEVLRSFRAKTSVIPLGLAEDDYPAPDEKTVQQWRSTLPPRFFVFVGVLRYYKGLHILLEAAKRCGLPVLIIGDGPMRPELEAQLAADDLSHVRFLGALSDTDKTAVLDLSLGLILPSHLRSEAFGLSLVEAAMAGKPMISCELGTGTSYVNLASETGLVVPPSNPAALADAMQSLWNDDAQAAEYGSAARLRYLENFTAERMADSYVQLYRSLSNT
jgi:rhamnosyl/mannosyltransferase